MAKLFCLVFFAISLVDSCLVQTAQNYEIEKVSPGGTYRVKIQVHAGPRKGTRNHTEHVKFEFFKHGALIQTEEGEEADQFEPSFRQSTPVIEWLSDNVLRTGQERSNQSFHDEFIVSNETGEDLLYFDLTYGKFETFWVFDVAAGSKISLEASPGFLPNGTSNHFAGYGGQTISGKKFEGTIEKVQRKSSSEGPFKFEITIRRKALSSDSHDRRW